MVVIGIDQG